MRYTILAASTFLGLTIAAPNALSVGKRDKFEPCTNFGSNCAVQDQEFCDSTTGKISVCHQFGSDCWIRYTQELCSAKRSIEAAEMRKRDKFDKCSVFGANCAVDGNEFCDAGRTSVCHHVPFSNECWIRYTATPCAGKRQAEPEPKVEAEEKRDLFAPCSAFGSNCAVDGNQFCENGRKSTCRHVPFSNDCWIQYSADGC